MGAAGAVGAVGERVRLGCIALSLTVQDLDQGTF